MIRRDRERKMAGNGQPRTHRVTWPMGPMVTMTDWERKWERKTVKNVVVAAEWRIERDGGRKNGKTGR